MSRSLKRTQKRTQKRSKTKQRGGKSPKNPWLQQLAEAKKNNTQEFKYNGKTYEQAVTKTGMVIYKSK